MRKQTSAHRNIKETYCSNYFCTIRSAIKSFKEIESYLAVFLSEAGNFNPLSASVALMSKPVN